MNPAIPYYALLVAGTLLSAIILGRQYWQMRETPAERRIRQLRALSNGRKPR